MKADFPQGDIEAEGTDVTSESLSNPSFETDNTAALSAVNNSADGLRGYSVSAPAHWTRTGSDVVSLIVNANCYTDNNFGLVTSLADGSQAYYLRMGWSTGTSTLSTQTTTMPKGKYRLSVDYRSAYANSASSSFTLTANGVSSAMQTFESGSSGIFTQMPWSTQSVDFELTETKAVDISLNVDWLSGGSCIMFDNLRLQQYQTSETVRVLAPLGTSPSGVPSAIYDLTGRRVGIASPSRHPSLQSGLYIVDGHKKILK